LAKGQLDCRNATEQEQISGSVPRIKGTECEMFIESEPFHYTWIPATIVMVSKKDNTMHVKMITGSAQEQEKTIVVPLTSLDILLHCTQIQASHLLLLLLFKQQ
jgi:hypothetical protein